MNCESCGMPMEKPEDRGGSKEDNMSKMPAWKE